MARLTKHSFLSFFLAFLVVVSPVSAQIMNTPSLNRDTSTIQGGAQGSGRVNNQVPSLSDAEQRGSQTFRKSGTSGQMLGLDQFSSQIKIHVLGEVENPGVYTISVSDRLSDVISLAGLKRSSQRVVEVRVPGERRSKAYDLYRYFHMADLKQNPYLMDNNVVYVPPARGAVRIEGPVARPGLYELISERNVMDIIKLAGGMSSAASKINPVKIIRFSEGGKKFIIDVTPEKKDLMATKILKGDIIIVSDVINSPEKFDYSVESIPGENLFYPTATPNVFVVGAVAQAGAFPYKSHLKVKDYVSYASPTIQARVNSVTMIRDGNKKKLRFDDRPLPGDVLVVKTKIGLGVVVATISTAMGLLLTTLLLEANLRDRI